MLNQLIESDLILLITDIFWFIKLNLKSLFFLMLNN